MAELIATVFTLDSRAVEVSARPGEVHLLFLSERESREMRGSIVIERSPIERLRFDPAGCQALEEALKAARLRVLADPPPC